jgi:hypothetical protein
MNANGLLDSKTLITPVTGKDGAEDSLIDLTKSLALKVEKLEGKKQVQFGRLSRGVRNIPDPGTRIGFISLLFFTQYSPQGINASKCMDFHDKYASCMSFSNTF